MKQTVYSGDFVRAFADANRANNFSVAGREALFDYLVDLEEDTGEEMELDVIALCCEFSEYENMDELRADYGDEYESIEDVEQETTVIEIDGSDGFIIQQF